MKGATFSNVSSGILHKVSIHAPMKGATYDFCVVINVFHSFNPRSHEGSDRTSWLKPFYIIRFQSTLP